MEMELDDAVESRIEIISKEIKEYWDETLISCITDTTLSGQNCFNIATLFLPRKIKNRNEDALERVGLFEKSNYHISQFSGGDRQRTKFDRAVCQTQKLLLLDEPTNHHDQAAKGPLLNAAMQLGIKVVTALHDLTLIDDFATHVVDLKKMDVQRESVTHLT